MNTRILAGQHLLARSGTLIIGLLITACSRSPDQSPDAAPAATPATRTPPAAPPRNAAATVAVAAAESLTVYKSPTCGCCTKWEDYMRDNGFVVTSVATNDLDPIKKRYGIAPTDQSCHTGIVAGYVVEGHVPVADVRRMLAERPRIRGIAAPGMPQGSPGMEGIFRDAYDVVTLEHDGAPSKIWARH